MSCVPKRRYPYSNRRGAAPTRIQLNAFLHHLGRTGSVSYAAGRLGLARNTLYALRARDAAFATRWQDAVDRAAASREGARQPHSALQYDNRLLQFLLRAHRPDVYRY
ncbi:MAG TPA: hypothetical protein VEB39_00775 [Sphingomicrobium sp.]|nr:hypothetical protein [Sphingomicrobium sp.]